MASTFPTLPQMPKMDWRTGAAQSHWSDPIAKPRQSGSYLSQLPAAAQNKPAFRTSIDNSFWDSVMGTDAKDEVLNTFGAQGVGKVGGYAGFGQFNAQQDSEIQAAAEKYGVPANFLKSILAAESSGKLSDAYRTSNIRPGSGPLLPYIGVFKNAADSRGLGHLWDQAIGNSAIQTEMLAGVLRSQYDQLQKQNASYGWNNVASYHYSGSPVPNGWQDEGGNGTNNAYTDKVVKWWKDLDARAGNTWNNYSSPKAQPSTGSIIGNIGSIWGGTAPRISQEFGKTAFSQSEKGQGMYGYAGGLGVQGHAGIDYSMNPGGQLRSPVGGKVITAGGTKYYTDDRYGAYVPGRGELRIKLDNGDELILGHMQNINVKVGQRINAGDLVGLSGTNNGGHVHVEYRQYKPGATESGYVALDPRKALIGSTPSVISKTNTQALQNAFTPVGLHGAGIQAARAAAGKSAVEFATLVNNASFLKRLVA